MALATIGLAAMACGGPSTIEPTGTTPPTSSASASTTCPTTTVAPASTALFTLRDAAMEFTITTDEDAATARFVVEPVDGGPQPRWETVVAVADEPNASGHRPLDGLGPVGTGDAAANRTLVADYIRTALVDNRWEEVDRFFHDGAYVLHGPLFADGLASVRSFFVGLRDAGTPYVISETVALLAEGDFVLAINRQDGDTSSTVIWDLWRVVDGAITEHWDAMATIDASVADVWFAGG